METRGGLIIEDFEVLEEPIERGLLEPHIYKGLVKNVPMSSFDGTLDFIITWDRFGKCSNLSRKDCFLNISDIPFNLKISLILYKKS